tara:strand:+ start:10 stop:291 length:282 start_codon:yes stop_codon:yes gene_type:complete
MSLRSTANTISSPATFTIFQRCEVQKLSSDDAISKITVATVGSKVKIKLQTIADMQEPWHLKVASSVQKKAFPPMVLLFGKKAIYLMFQQLWQ